jgi:hypothetical protein
VFNVYPTGQLPEDRKELAHIMIQEVGIDVPAKRGIWLKSRPDFDVLF